VFAEFMRSYGFDGLIALEGGEGSNFDGSDSFVFYNYSVVGTKEDWIERKKQKSDKEQSYFNQLGECIADATPYFPNRTILRADESRVERVDSDANLYSKGVGLRSYS
jgi:hypothetical protein